MKAQAEAVAAAVCPGHLDVFAHLSTKLGTHIEERVVLGDRAVVRQPQDDAGKAAVVGFRTILNVLELAAQVLVTVLDVEHAVGPEDQRAGVVIAPDAAAGVRIEGVREQSHPN